MDSPSAIDAAYTWVDGTRAEYLALVARYSSAPRDLNPERFRDTFSLLRYSLRSLERHAPWIRNVYLFTCRPQVPGWILREHPRLRIVHHDEVMPDDGTLPTFNSNVIDSHLHLLPGISGRFLYLNDDYLLGSAVTPEDFVAGDGRMKVFGTVAGEALRPRIYERHLISLGLLEHGPILVDKALWSAAMDSAPADLAKLRGHRFRTQDEVRPERLYRWYLLRHARQAAVAEPFWRYLRYSVFHKIRKGARRQRAGLAAILGRRPKLLCLNDDLGDAPDPEVTQAVRAFLEELLPGPGSFEKPGD